VHGVFASHETPQPEKLIIPPPAPLAIASPPAPLPPDAELDPPKGAQEASRQRPNTAASAPNKGQRARIQGS